MHYIYVKAKTKDAIPLVLTHGWPWTFWDFKDMIIPLAEAGFDVVVPSIPDPDSRRCTGRACVSPT